MAATVGGFAKRYVGDLSGPLVHTFVDEDKKIFPLTNVNPLTQMSMRLKPHNQTARDGAGHFIMIDSAKGQAAWVWNAADVATEGLVSFQAKITFEDGDKHFEVIDIDFEQPI